MEEGKRDLTKPKECEHKNLYALNREIRRRHPALKKANVSHYCPDCKQYFRKAK